MNTNYYYNNYSTDLSQLFRLLHAKKQFFLFILINILIQIAITYYVHVKFDEIEITKDADQRRIIIIAAHILGFVLIIILGIVSMPIWLKFIIFSLVSVTMGIILEDVKTIADLNTIKTILLGIASIFVSMFAFGLVLIESNIQLKYKFELGLYFALISVLISTIVQYFIYYSSIIKKLALVVLLLLLTIYIMFTTNNIVQRNYYGDFIAASLAYYIDIFNIMFDAIRK
uniref:Inhibitor of apoptosis-promoting Bax1 n=1 Tax=viral metagenome TaxID=1070528 RepID=A0A6C0DWR4_9ZZZZ